MGEAFAERMKGNCLWFAKIFEVEELTTSVLFRGDRAMVALEGVETVSLRKESMQLLKVVKFTASYMLFLVIVYFIQTLICISYLDPEDFNSAFKSRQYAQEIYEYSVTIERMKVLHAMALGSIAVATLYFTLKFKMLNPKHYC